MEWYQALREFGTYSAIFRIVLAFVVGGIIGVEREKSGRPAGLRTHILVCLGSTMTVLIGLYASEYLQLNTDPMRVAAQVVSGIGFLGVGTILVKGHDHITGLTTAAGLWATATVGIAIGIGFYEAAFVCVLIMILTTAILYRFEKKKTERRRGNSLYIELSDAGKVNELISFIEATYPITEVRAVNPKSAGANAVGLELNITLHKEGDYEEMISSIRNRDEVLYVM